MPIRWEELDQLTQIGFLMNSRIKLENWYIDESTGPQKSFSEDEINVMIAKAKLRLPGESYDTTDKCIYESLDNFSIKDKSVFVMGSTIPWYEAIILSLGGIPFTIDYNKPMYFHPQLTVMTVEDYWKSPFKADFAFSISSFEHDGLGLYGDPIDPNGDIRAMREMKNILNKNGILFLAVPIGKDKIVWNAHRIYGKERLPLLIENWELLGTVGMEDEDIERNTGISGAHQPIIVLKNI